jgi:hypothetical protein
MAWDSDREWKRARRLSGLARFERETRRTEQEYLGWGAYVLAWKKAGTAEYAQHQVYARIAQDIYWGRKCASDIDTILGREAQNA